MNTARCISMNDSSRQYSSQETYSRMVLILDGNSEIGTHTHSETVKLIYLRHLNRITAIESYLKKNICFASNVSNVFWFTI